MKRVNEKGYKILTSKYEVKIIEAKDGEVLVKLLGKKRRTKL